MSDDATASTSKDDGWDWPYIVYIGRVWLCYTEAELWQLTPRKFMSQLSVHEDITATMHGTTSKNGRSAARQPTGFIDQIPGW